MDYQKHYYTMMERAKSRLLEGYVERHHIIPKCLGGSNDLDNLVQLTPEEHYVAHQLLIKMYPGNHKLVFAAKMMTVNQPRGKRTTRKMYGWIRRKWIESASVAPRKPRKKETKPRNRVYVVSEAQKQKVSASLKARNYHHSPETRERIRQSNIKTKALKKCSSLHG